MKNSQKIFVFAVCAWPYCLWAGQPAVISPSGGLIKMLVGLLTVLAVMALIAYLLKRILPAATGRPSLLRVLGGVSVGSRERVVLLDVAGRLLVVGVAPGRVSQLASLDLDAAELLQAIASDNHPAGTMAGNLSTSFAHWLIKSSNNMMKKPSKN